jgi:hypothetical protein
MPKTEFFTLPSSVGNQQFGRTSFALFTLDGVAIEILTDELAVSCPTADESIEQPVRSPEVGEKGLDAIRRGPQTVHEQNFSGPERC